jgi:hypothetical protein
MQETREGLFARAGLAFNNGDLDVGRDEFGLGNDFAPRGINGDELRGDRYIDLMQVGSRFRKGRTEGCELRSGIHVKEPPLSEV